MRSDLGDYGAVISNGAKVNLVTYMNYCCLPTADLIRATEHVYEADKVSLRVL